MATFEQGDVVKVPFPYTDRSTRQYRPALVVSNGAIGDDQSLLWVVMITSAENRGWPDDLSFGDAFQASGLPVASLIRPRKIATIEAGNAERLGRADDALVRKVIQTIQRLLGRPTKTDLAES